MLGVLLLAYAPTVLIACRLVKFSFITKVLYGLTAAPIFLILLIVNIALIEIYCPWISQAVRQARPIQGRFRTSPLICSYCIIPLVGSWLWYRFFGWIDRISRWPDSPTEFPAE
ncbi:MAG: hypothetical protein JWN70_221 [Planctomycetaceae bacterium]|nr:hypothetical protein [Planctomycetaceae bacterium]